jgi:Sec-independent protein secretion pathway component TatC
MLLLAIPCVVLVELAEVFVWLNDRRRARRDALYEALAEGEIADLPPEEDPAASAGVERPG